MLQINNVCLSFPTMKDLALNDVSLELAHGSCTCLVGPSGSGKTSLLRIIAGLETADSGSICMDGRDISDVPAEKRDIVMVFQSDFLFPFLSIEQNIAFGLNFSSMSKEEKDREVKTMLELVQLPHVGTRMPHQLSSGQRQRIALARSLVLKPKVLLLDEPLSNLDPDLQQTMRELLLIIKNTLDITLFCVTHSPEDILLLADSIGFLSEGKLIQYGNNIELFERPRAPEVAIFFGNSNFLQASYHKDAIHCMQERIPVKHWPEHWVEQLKDFAEGSEILLSCRPEHSHIRPSRQGAQQQGKNNNVHYDPKRGLLMQAKIEHYAYSPTGTRYYLSTALSMWNVQQKDHLADDIHAGYRVEIEAPKEHLWIMQKTAISSVE